MSGRGCRASATPHRDIERRIDHLLARAARRVDSRLFAELQDVLTSGYAHALHGDAQSRRLRRRLDVLADHIDDADAANEGRRLVLELRAAEESTQALRSRLEVVRGQLGELRAAGGRA